MKMQRVKTQANAAQTTWHLTPNWHKMMLILHIISGIDWMGVDIALLVCAPHGRLLR